MESLFARSPIRALLLEDNADHAELVRRCLGRGGDAGITLEWIDRLAKAKERLAAGDVDVVLVDLSLPDSDVLCTLSTMLELAPDVPLVVLTSLDDIEFATRAVQEGAQDYLVKTKLTRDSLERSIRYAIERKRTQLELKRYAARLERHNQELRQFAHTVAHEVKSPLSVVVYLCAILQRRCTETFDKETASFVENTRKAVEGLNRLVNELLEFASADSPDRRFQPVDCAQLLEQALENLEPAIAESGATVTSGPLPQLSADPVQVRQLLQNLIGNALKYRGEPLPRIHISAQPADDGWQFSVCDNGIGIAPRETERVFDLFYRLNHNASSGSGIGLAFCKRIVQHHGGRIWVDSEPGRGSVFHFTIPTNSGAESLESSDAADLAGEQPPSP
jgi:signal transduction histidine kinase